MLGLFITGTDTGVGKTWITCQLAKLLRQQGLKVGAYKPVCSGAVADPATGERVWEDVQALAAATGHLYPSEWICPQRFLAPLAPPIAARQEGRSVDFPQMVEGVAAWRAAVDILLVEGVGGWRCPLTERETVREFASALNFPVVVVAPNILGMLNHTLLTVDSVREAGLKMAAVVINTTQATVGDEAAQTNAQALRRWLPNLAVLGPLAFEPISVLGDSANMPLELSSIDWSQLVELSTVASPDI